MLLYLIQKPKAHYKVAKIFKINKHYAPIIFHKKQKNIFLITFLLYDRAEQFLPMEKVTEKVKELEAIEILCILNLRFLMI